MDYRDNPQHRVLLHRVAGVYAATVVYFYSGEWRVFTPALTQGQARIDAIRQVQITEQTFYRWRKQYGGMGTAQLKELKRLHKENERLRRAVSDLTLDKLILTEATRGNF